MTEAEAAAAPDKQYLTELHSGGKTYHVYVYRWGEDAAVRRWEGGCGSAEARRHTLQQEAGPAWCGNPVCLYHKPHTLLSIPSPPLSSYLGYGLMAGRAAVLSEEEAEANGEGHPCVPLGHQGTYEYAGKTMQMRPHSVGVEWCM